ncbi:MAG: DUF2188 domain-containing protein [Bacteroidetes bacterium]|nr:DUF2188 domain-containing protein [Bacteroidota bacterium]
MQANIKRVHIISRHNEGWAVKKQGASRALKVYPTKDDALFGAFPYLQLGYDLVIHRKDGSVEQYKKADETSRFVDASTGKKPINGQQKRTNQNTKSVKK